MHATLHRRPRTIDVLWLPVLFAVVITLLGGIGAAALHRSIEDQVARRNLERNEQARAGVEAGVRVYRVLLRSTRGLALASPALGADQFAAFGESVHQSLTLPRPQVLSLAVAVPVEQEAAWAAAMDSRSGRIALGYPPAQVHPATGDLAMAVSYLYPVTGNEAAYGFDLRSETVRRVAVDDALHTQDFVVTAPIHLVQAPEEPAILLLTGYQQPAAAAITGSTGVAGVASIAVRGAEFATTAFRRDRHTSALYDAGAVGDPLTTTALYVGRDYDTGAPTSVRASDNTSTLVVGGRRWIVATAPETYSSLPLAEQLSPFLLLLLGAALGIAVAGLLYSTATARWRATALAADMTVELRGALDARQRFLSRASHELRTPLNGVAGFAQVLEHTSLDETQQRYVANIREASLRQLRLLDDLLELSKLKEQTAPGPSTPVSLRELVDDVLTVTSVAYPGVELTVDVPVGLTVEADADDLRLVVGNLLTNALKYGGGSVTVRGGGDGTTARLAVADRGAGIDPADRERIFEAFERVQRDAAVSGTGLGLAIAQTAALSLGGTIELESTVGQGSTFTFVVPRRRSDQR